jgi:hypothetical protein
MSSHFFFKLAQESNHATSLLLNLDLKYNWKKISLKTRSGFLSTQPDLGFKKLTRKLNFKGKHLFLLVIKFCTYKDPIFYFY